MLSQSSLHLLHLSLQLVGSLARGADVGLPRLERREEGVHCRPVVTTADDRECRPLNGWLRRRCLSVRLSRRLSWPLGWPLDWPVNLGLDWRRSRLRRRYGGRLRGRLGGTRRVVAVSRLLGGHARDCLGYFGISWVADSRGARRFLLRVFKDGKSRRLRARHVRHARRVGASVSAPAHRRTCPNAAASSVASLRSARRLHQLDKYAARRPWGG